MSRDRANSDRYGGVNENKSEDNFNSLSKHTGTESPPTDTLTGTRRAVLGIMGTAAAATLGSGIGSAGHTDSNASGFGHSSSQKDQRPVEPPDPSLLEEYGPEYNTIPAEATEANVDTLLDIHSEEDVAQKRQAMIEFIWKGEGIPTDLPDEINRDITDERFDDLTNLESIDEVIIKMKYEMESHVYLFKPKQSNSSHKNNNRLVMYNQGHTGEFVNGKRTIQALLEEGYAVLAFSMPLTGEANTGEVINPENSSQTIDLGEGTDAHNQFDIFKSDDFSPLQFFFSPLAIGMNYAEAEYNCRSIDMVGLSGGGLTTVFAAAIFSRIKHSYPVAGTHPVYLRKAPPINDFPADWEQTAAAGNDVFEAANVNYLDLFAMGAHGKSRKQVQVLNRYDACCFAGVGYRTYEETVAERVAMIGPGSFEVIGDATHDEHQISEYALDIISYELAN